MKASDNNAGPIPLWFLPVADQGAKKALERRDGQGFIPELTEEKPPAPTLLQALYDAAFKAAHKETTEFGNAEDLFVADLIDAIAEIAPDAAHQISEGLKDGEAAQMRERAATVDTRKGMEDQRLDVPFSIPAESIAYLLSSVGLDSRGHRMRAGSLRPGLSLQSQAGDIKVLGEMSPDGTKFVIYDEFHDLSDLDGKISSLRQAEKSAQAAVSRALKNTSAPLNEREGSPPADQEQKTERAHISVFLEKLGYAANVTEHRVLSFAADLARACGFRSVQGVDATVVNGVAEWWERDEQKKELKRLREIMNAAADEIGLDKGVAYPTEDMRRFAAKAAAYARDNGWSPVCCLKNGLPDLCFGQYALWKREAR